jgi:hypothetical protein
MADDYTTWVHFPKSADYHLGDLIYSGGQSYRIESFEPYTHPDPETAKSFGEQTRIAHCEADFAITMTEHGSWPKPWNETPPKYRERFLAARNTGAPAGPGR